MPVGQHLIDAIPDRDIADAVLQSLARSARAANIARWFPGARGYDVSIVVSREERQTADDRSRASEVAV